MLVLQLSWWPLNYLLDSCLGFTHDGEGGTTSGRGFGMSGITTLSGRQVNGQGKIVAEAFEAVTLLFHFGEFSVCTDTSNGSTWFWHIGRHCWRVAQFCWCGSEGGLPSLTRWCSLLTLAFPVVSVTLQGISLELLVLR